MCWNQNPSDRPTFDEIVKILRDDSFAIEEFGMKTDLDELHEYQNRIDVDFEKPHKIIHKKLFIKKPKHKPIKKIGSNDSDDEEKLHLRRKVQDDDDDDDEKLVRKKLEKVDSNKNDSDSEIIKPKRSLLPKEIFEKPKSKIVESLWLQNQFESNSIISDDDEKHHQTINKISNGKNIIN